MLPGGIPDCVLPSRYANRAISTVVERTCTYIDVAGLRFFDADAKGRLGWNVTDYAKELAASVKDVRAALVKVPLLTAATTASCHAAATFHHITRRYHPLKCGG